MNDEKIIELLFSRNEDALREIQAKYSSLIKGIARGILGDESDVCEIENDVLLSAWNSIPPTRPHHLPSFLCKIARSASIDRLRYYNRKKRGGEFLTITAELCEIADDFDDSADRSERIGSVINDFVSSLDAETQVLFVRRYFYLESVSSLSLRFGMKENQISVKLYRARKKLKSALKKEGITI